MNFPKLTQGITKLFQRSKKPPIDQSVNIEKWMRELNNEEKKDLDCITEAVVANNTGDSEAVIMNNMIAEFAMIQWCQNGRTIIRVPHDLAAAFCLTDTPSNWEGLPIPLYQGCIEIMIPQGEVSPFVDAPDARYLVWGMMDHPITSDGEEGLSFRLYRSGGDDDGTMFGPLKDMGIKDVKTHQGYHMMLCLFFNTIAYMNECGIFTIGDITKVSSKKKVGSMKGARVWNMPPVKLDQNVTRLVSEHAKTGRAFKISHKFLVRGHWRRQPIGSRKDPRYKMTWIKPYWKGPETSEVYQRVYSMGSK